MSLVGHKAKTHPQQGSAASVDDRATDPDVFDAFDREFGFTIDVAASAHNAKVERSFTIEEDGLAQSWEGERVWCNPPYSTLTPWVEKAWRECERAQLVVMLLPANRAEQRWWQELIEPWRDRPDSLLRTRFLPGRLRFIAPGAERIGANERPPFGCVLAIWRRGPLPDGLILGPEPQRMTFGDVSSRAGR